MGVKREGIGFFERYLSLWVIACIVVGVLIGQWVPAIPTFLSTLEYARVSLPITILIWLMIFPMMLKVDFRSITAAAAKPKGLIVTTVTNWLIKPFTMYAISFLFLKVLYRPFIASGLATEYLAGAVLLGAAPCTAMVFVWSHLSDGDPAYTVVQVALNDLIILIAFTPIVAFLLGISDIRIPYDTLVLSVVLFVVIPLTAGYLTRRILVARKGLAWFEQEFLGRFRYTTIGGLLLTLVIIFSYQGDVMINQPLHIALIALPFILQTFFIFFFAYGWGRAWKLPYAVAAPAAMIGASNFFELSVAVAVSLFGVTSGAALATVVGVLVEVPVMLTLVRIAQATRWDGSGSVIGKGV